MHNYKPSPIQWYQIVPVCQRLHGEIVSTNCDIHKHDEQRQTKKLTLLAAPAAGEIRDHQTWHGDRRPRARSCTSKLLGSDAQFRR